MDPDQHLSVIPSTIGTLLVVRRVSVLRGSSGICLSARGVVWGVRRPSGIKEGILEPGGSQGNPGRWERVETGASCAGQPHRQHHAAAERVVNGPE